MKRAAWFVLPVVLPDAIRHPAVGPVEGDAIMEPMHS